MPMLSYPSQPAPTELAAQLVTRRTAEWPLLAKAAVKSRQLFLLLSLLSMLAAMYLLCATAGRSRLQFPSRSASPNGSLTVSTAERPMALTSERGDRSVFPTTAIALADTSATVSAIAAPPSTTPPSKPIVVLLWTPFWDESFEGFMNGTLLPSWPCSRFCHMIYDRQRVREADAVLFHAWDFQRESSPSYRSASQLWVFFNLEPPPFGFVTSRHDRVFNLTMTYRNDSDLPVGYGHFSLAVENRSLPDYGERKPYAYWMAGNCAASRMNYVRELSRYIKVDILGKCAPPGSPQCRSSECEQELSSGYAFYLAFENSLCPYYVTEKLWRTLASPGGAIPVVIGAPLSHYVALAPPDSFVHAENFTSARELGAFLAKVASSSDSFLYYHRWRARYEAHSSWAAELAGGVCRLCDAMNSGEPLGTPAKTSLSHWANAGCRSQWPH